MYIKIYFYDNLSNNLSQPSNSVNQINNTQNDQNKTSFIKSLMDSRVNSSRNNLLEDEIYRYSNMDVNEYYDDPLEFFRINKSSFPLLCKIVKHLFCITASSVPSECLFSHAGQICTDLRNRLDSDNIEFLLFIKENLNNN